MVEEGDIRRLHSKYLEQKGSTQTTNSDHTLVTSDGILPPPINEAPTVSNEELLPSGSPVSKEKEEDGQRITSPSLTTPIDDLVFLSGSFVRFFLPEVDAIREILRDNKGSKQATNGASVNLQRKIRPILNSDATSSLVEKDSTGSNKSTGDPVSEDGKLSTFFYALCLVLMEID